MAVDSPKFANGSLVLLDSTEGVIARFADGSLFILAISSVNIDAKGQYNLLLLRVR